MMPAIRTRIALLALVAIGTSTQAEDFDRAPINYTAATPDNLVSRLQARINRGDVKLDFADDFGYLPSVLKEFKIPISSQMLVFSKTSLQRDRIAPRTPRALYFNDEMYVGFCHIGEVMEVSVSDTKLGTVFYTLRQEPAEKPQFARHTENCLSCHASRHQGIPAHMVRSVFPDRDGNPILSGGSYRVDQTTPIKHRWGGWYVTGTHGNQKHLGNMIMPKRLVPDDPVNETGLNCTDLKGRIDTGMYLSPHSDLVALMVLEHQTEMHNRITAANYQTQYAHRDADIINQLDGVPHGRLTESTSRRVDSAAEQLIEYLLFCDEAPLEGPMKGCCSFAEEFSQRGPRDKKGRSLRDFDLTKRLFKYPCSYLIYSPAFDGLPTTVKERIYHRLWDILNGKAKEREYQHLTVADRQAIKEILIDTKPGLPEYWK